MYGKITSCMGKEYYMYAPSGIKNTVNMAFNTGGYLLADVLDSKGKPVSFCLYQLEFMTAVEEKDMPAGFAVKLKSM